MRSNLWSVITKVLIVVDSINIAAANAAAYCTKHGVAFLHGGTKHPHGELELRGQKKKKQMENDVAD